MKPVMQKLDHIAVHTAATFRRMFGLTPRTPWWKRPGAGEKKIQLSLAFNIGAVIFTLPFIGAMLYGANESGVAAFLSHPRELKHTEKQNEDHIVNAWIKQRRKELGLPPRKQDSWYEDNKAHYDKLFAAIENEKKTMLQE